ncbi:MAG: NAD(P)/FAD-dependent oxidoreductase [Dehalococcoidia bacterium]|jgi:all-trans-retinol 13,14-reductase|nr:NAD(P)/FAD-dependent oxidoreductase [Dehalococcoidia bacterium]
MSRQETASQEPHSSTTKLPEALFLALSFLPWVVYWLFADRGDAAGIAIALGVSVALLVQQVRTKLYRLLDITSLAYFIAAAVVTYAGLSRLFIEMAGPVSFGVLTAMAVVSLAVRRPFSADEARHAYPRQYWRNPAFLTLHNIVTAVWSGVFLLSTILLAFEAVRLVGPVPVGLVLAGLVFAFVFQKKGPAYLVAQRFKPFEWHVPLSAASAKQQNEYDVAVVGAGMGGLTCAALLAKRGYKVLVMEQQQQVGGYFGSLMRDKYVFSTGVTGISGVWENGPVTKLLRALDIDPEGRFVRHSTGCVYGGKAVNLPSGALQLAAALSQMFPEEREHIDAFYREASDAYYQLHDYSSTYGSPLPDHLVVRLMGEKATANLPRTYPTLYDWLDKTFQQKLDEHFGNDNLKRLVAATAGQNGTKADVTPGLRALIGCVGPQMEGLHYPVGGPRAFARAIADVVERHGGAIMPSYRTDRILSDGRRVRGIRSGAEIFQAHVVVANVNARACVLQLIEAQEAGGPFIDFFKGLKMSSSAFIVYVGVEHDLGAYPSLIQHVDGDFTILINSNADKRLAPLGCSSVTLVAPMGYREFPERDTREYDDRKRQFAALLVRKAAEAIPELGSSVVVLDAATPRTLEAYTGTPEGALYSFDQSVDGHRPHFRAPIKGLYFAGASTYPGAGVESVIMSGMICANDIAGWTSGTGSK